MKIFGSYRRWYMSQHYDPVLRTDSKILLFVVFDAHDVAHVVGCKTARSLAVADFVDFGFVDFAPEAAYFA